MFTKWKKWANRNEIPDIKYPGVYILLFSEVNVENSEFDYKENIIYIGMSRSAKGLKGRMNQFDFTVKKGVDSLHGGAERVRFKHNNYDKLKKSLYISARIFKCDATSNNPKDLRTKGKVVEFEYICFAEYVERFGKLPEFNDMKRSPKR